MKSEIANTNSVKTFPMLKRYCRGELDYVVLFYKASCGVIVHINSMTKEYEDEYIVGHHSNEWCDELFVDFNDAIKLSNI